MKGKLEQIDQTNPMLKGSTALVYKDGAPMRVHNSSKLQEIEMENKQQTAVQQMIDFVNNINDNDGSEFNYYYDSIITKLNELLEVEKEQLNIARLDGINLVNKGYGK